MGQWVHITYGVYKSKEMRLFKSVHTHSHIGKSSEIYASAYA